MDHPISYIVVAIVSIIATKLGDYLVAQRKQAATEAIELKRQAQQECQDEDNRADKAYLVAIELMAKDKAQLLAHIDVMDAQIKALQAECRDCESRHSALAMKVAFLEKELSELKGR